MSIPVPSHLLSLDNILPEEPLLMMGAGPVPIPAKVAAANGIVINHLGDTMAQIIEQVKLMSRYVFQTETGHILGVAGPGSAAMEMAVANLVVPGSKVLSVCNGFFSSRLAEMAQRVEAEVIRLDVEEGLSADPQLVEQYIVEHQPQVITIVQGETSSTVCNRQLAAIAAVAKKHQCLVIVDAVCTLSTMPFNMDEWGIDAVITGGQKGLSCIPGVSLIGFSSKAWGFIQSRSDQLRHWCLDAKLADQFWYKKSYHYTAPVSGILAIHEALRLVCTETLETRFARHLHSSQALQAGIEGMGLSLYAKPEHRLNSVVGINMPTGVDAKQLLSTMSKRYKVEISGSFGANIVRIGQMGEQCRTHNLFRTLHAFGASFNLLGQKLDLPAGMAALESTLDQHGYVVDEI
ncbi:pyridoxal-phosphate-dependent aminotransferase family protein [Paraglaciecola sp.]|uniref:pyridoxal-phosphate-dependent aminotransferase family protein n=1 Tax=Paraglaciecola sp. TaxID=1920173 RepID=UPI003EF2EAE4